MHVRIWKKNIDLHTRCRHVLLEGLAVNNLIELDIVNPSIV